MGQRLKSKQLHLDLDEKALEFLVQKGYDPVYGARPMRRAVEQYLEDPLAEELLRGNLHPNDPVQVALENDKLVFTQKSSAASAFTSTGAS